MRAHFLPLTISVVHEDELDCVIVSGIMERDFGPWKKDALVELCFDFATGVVSQHAEDGEVLETVRLRLEPEEPS